MNLWFLGLTVDGFFMVQPGNRGPWGHPKPNVTGFKTPQEIAGPMIRDYENPLLSLNKAAIRAGYFFGGVALGWPL